MIQWTPKNLRKAIAIVSMAIFLVLARFAHAPTLRQERLASATDAPAVAQATTSVRVPILVYHNVRPTPRKWMSASDKQYEVTPAEFEAEMAYLESEGYAAIGFGDLLAAQRGEKPLPEKPVLITLDDGRESQYENALPSLRAHHLTATFFVFSNAIGRPEYFTWDQLKELRADGMTVAGHTRYHPYLTRITDDAELVAEIAGSKKALEDGVGAPVEYLAYPFGMYDDRVIAETRAAGYLAARGLEHRATHAPEDAYKLGGFIATGDLKRFKAILASP